MDAMIQRLADLERRCAAAERANRYWRSVALAVLTAGAAAVGCGMQKGGGPSNGKAFECERLRIVEGGKVLAEIGSRHGSAEFALFDKDEHARISIGVRKDGNPQVTLLDAAESVRMQSSIEASGEALHAMYDRNRKGSIVTRVYAGGAMDSTFFAPDLQQRYGVEVNASGDVNMALQHRNKSRIIFTLPEDGDFSQSFFDAKNIPRIRLSLYKDGGCGLILLGPGGGSKTGLMAMNNGTVGQTLNSSDGTTTVATIVSSDSGAASMVEDRGEITTLYRSKRAK